jgi:hypothetical protein
MTPLEEGIAKGIVTSYQGDPIHWLEEHVRLPHSARSTRFDGNAAPWLNDIIRAVKDDRVKQIVVRAPTGGGKSTLLELLSCWIVAQQPGPMMLVGTTDDTAKEWAESRLMPVFNACPPVARLFPEDRHQKRKTSIMFPHMALFLAGANMTSLQEKSMRYVYMDETWQYKPGMIGEAKRRTHDRWNAKVIMVTQGWATSTADDGGVHDMDREWASGEVREWGVECPACNQWHKMLWTSIVYDEAKTPHGDWDWQALAASVRHKCPECGHETPDTTAHRRAMAARGSYHSEGGNYVAGNLSFTFSALAVWWIPWADLAIQWVQAMTDKARGVIDPLRQFRQKRLANVWVNDNEAPPINLLSADYRKADYSNGEKIEQEQARLLTVDVQQDHLWALIRAWRSDGTSMLLWEGKVLTFETLRDLQLRMGVRDNLVFIDSGYESGKVYEWCAKFSAYNQSGWVPNSGWTALKGAAQERFAHTVNGKRVDRFFSPPSKVAAASGRHCRLVVWSNTIVKDRLVQLRSVGDPTWSFPSDVSDHWQKQMNSEVKRDVVNKVTKAVAQQYVKIYRHNHLWDCEVMQVAAAHFLRLLPDPTLE